MEAKLNTEDIKYGIAGDFFRLNAGLAFLFICTIYALALYIQQEFILTKELYYNTLGEQLTIERIDAFLQLRSKWVWLSYAFIPIMVLLQALLVSICLSTGAILMDYKIPFAQIFNIVVKALLVFALGKVCYLAALQFQEIRTIEDLIQADVFSLLGWLGTDGIPEWLLYPLGVINIFEIFFWFVLAAIMGYLLKRPARQMLGFVSATYGIGLLIWIALVVFIQLNLQ